MSSLQLRNYSWLQTDSLAYGETKSDYDNFDKFQTYHHATKFFVFRKIKSEDFSQVPWFLPKREVVFQASKGGLILTLLSFMTNPWTNKYQNWNTFYSPNISHSLKIQKIFCCMRCDTRTRVFNFWNFRCRKRSKKGL